MNKIQDVIAGFTRSFYFHNTDIIDEKIFDANEAETLRTKAISFANKVKEIINQQEN